MLLLSHLLSLILSPWQATLRLEAAVALLARGAAGGGDGVDVVRLRHRRRAGEPLWVERSFEAAGGQVRGH